MADNVTLPASGVDVATDEIGGKHYEKVKLVRGEDGSTTPVNPATEETLEEMNNTIYYLRRIAHLLECLDVTDANARQRVVVENASSQNFGRQLAGTDSGGGTAVPNMPSVAVAPYAATSWTYWQPVWSGPVDPRYQIIDQARNSYANGIRSNLTWS
jgi:hypothetical protein